MAERLLRKHESQETQDDYLMYLRHLAAYQFALSQIDLARVIDLGCGTGYGTELLGKRAKLVAGVDQAGYALPNATQGANTRFLATDVCKLPFADASFDLAVSFQVIEHIPAVNVYLREAQRVLSKNGLMILSTPNRNLRLWPLERPWNPYHVKEYSPTQLRLLLQKYFTIVYIYGLQAIPEIEMAERRRLRSARQWYFRNSVLEAISKLPSGGTGVKVVRTVKRFILPKAGRKSGSTKMSEPTGKSFQQIYSSKDFWVSNSQVNQRMDLIAVCQK